MNRFRKLIKKIPLEFIFLIIIVIIVEFIIFDNIPILYFVDVYNYLNQANEIALTGNIFSYTSRGFPFIWFLSLMIKIFSPFTSDLIFISKITMFFITLISYSIIYFTIKLVTKNRMIAFFSVFFILIDPSFIQYSLIAYLEPFTLLFAWLAIYLSLKYFHSNSKIFFILSITSSIIAGLTRFEMFIIITFPIFIVFLFRGFRLEGEKKFTILILIGLIFFFILFSPLLLEYYNSISRFDFFTRSFLGLSNIDVIKNTMYSISSITDEIILNTIFRALWIIGIIIFVKKVITNRSYRKTPMEFSSILFILIIFTAIFISIAFYGFTYKIIDGIIIITPNIMDRLSMYSKVFIIPLFIYGLYELVLTFSRMIFMLFQKIFKSIEIKKWKFKVVMKNFNLKKTSYILTFCFISTISFIYFPSSWNKGIRIVSNNKYFMETFKDTGTWLENVIEDDDLVFLSFDYIFYILYPNLKENIIDYEYIWEKSRISYNASTTPEDFRVVRNTLIEEIKNNTNIRYLVVDWFSKTTSVFNLNVTDELYDLIFLIHVETVKSGPYRPSILIFEVF